MRTLASANAMNILCSRPNRFVPIYADMSETVAAAHAYEFGSARLRSTPNHTRSSR
jgi:hypothetical protein